MITKSLFGTTPSGKAISRFKFRNNMGMEVTVIELGATITSIIVPDKHGDFNDVALGYKNLEGYLNNGPHLGETIGRSAGRIFPAEITIKGRSYALDKNDGENNLHGGKKALGKRIFHSKIESVNGIDTLIMTTTIQHLDDDFPGELTVSVSFRLTDNGSLDIEYSAVSTEDTMINLTNHSYFNLDGHGSGEINSHQLTLTADWYSAYSPTGIPEEIRKVDGTVFDFRKTKTLASAIESSDLQIKLFNGIDNGFLLSGEGYRKIGELYSPKTKRLMEVFTSESCVQVYTSNMLSLTNHIKDNGIYGVHDAICLETQNLPNSNHMPWLKSSIYQKGEIYSSKTSYKFSVV